MCMNPNDSEVLWGQPSPDRAQGRIAQCRNFVVAQLGQKYSLEPNVGIRPIECFENNRFPFLRLNSSLHSIENLEVSFRKVKCQHRIDPPTNTRIFDHQSKFVPLRVLHDMFSPRCITIRLWVETSVLDG